MDKDLSCNLTVKWHDKPTIENYKYCFEIYFNSYGKQLSIFIFRLVQGDKKQLYQNVFDPDASILVTSIHKPIKLMYEANCINATAAVSMPILC